MEDIAPNLGQIQEPFNARLRASNESADEGKPPQSEKDNDTSALEEYLANRLQQVGEVPTQLKEVKGLKTGNGWDANKVIEQVCKIEPISIKRAIEIAVTSNRTLKERLLRLFSRRQEQGNITGSPTVEFVPIWKVKGFHECYYLRSNSYRVNLRNDVVGVELEGKGRDLILEKKHLGFIPSAIVDRFQRLSSFMTNESKYFVITDVTELATNRSEAEFVISAGGRSLSEEEEMMLTSWRTKRIFDTSDLKVRGAVIKVRESAFSKEFILEKFRERVVRMPERFKQILSNKLQITDLRRIYIPFIKVPIQKGLVPRDVMINGTSGEPADKGLLELLE